MRFQVTVRYGTRYQRYHTFEVEAGDPREALARAADGIPDEIAAEADLVEIRPSPEPEARPYLGQEEEGG